MACEGFWSSLCGSEAVSEARLEVQRGVTSVCGCHAKRQFRNVIKTEVRPACEDFWSSLCGSEAVSEARLEAQRGFAGAKRQFRNVIKIKTKVRPRWDGMRGLLMRLWSGSVRGRESPSEAVSGGTGTGGGRVETARLHPCGGPGRRPALARARQGRRIASQTNGKMVLFFINSLLRWPNQHFQIIWPKKFRNFRQYFFNI